MSRERPSVTSKTNTLAVLESPILLLKWHILIKLIENIRNLLHLWYWLLERTDW